MRVSTDRAARHPAAAVTVTGTLQKAAWATGALSPVEQLPGGIWSVPVPIPGNPLRYTLTYLLPGRSGLVAVDPGWDSAEGWSALCGGADRGGGGTIRCDRHRGDPCPSRPPRNDGPLKAASDAWVAMHPAERDSLPHRRTGSAPSATDEARAWLLEAGAPDDDVLELLGPAGRDELLLEDGDIVPLDGREVVALWTPGHTPGHLCLAESAARVVLTGDHVLPRITPTTGLHGRQPGQAPLAAFLDSLRRLAAWDDHEALPAHEHRLGGLAARTGHLRDHHAERLEELLKVVDELGSPTLWEAAAHLSWSRSWDQVGVMRFAALAETDAHAQHLVDRGRLTWSVIGLRPLRLSRFPAC